MVRMMGTAVAVCCGVNIREYCWWCKYLDYVPSKWWSCNGDQMKCEMGVSTWQLTLTCMSSSDSKIRLWAEDNTQNGWSTEK
ncbi:RHOMBOID-like protein 8 isoform X2 [Impatiens glandulifera]|nr:RHOMBOID-like protein 8 isoform X2 [Impatiens glandulifera]